jgi:ribonuclease HII
MSVPPSLRLERQLLRQGAARVAGVDEVGRGAIAGPVSVGVAVVSSMTRTAPSGLRDSKLLSASRREELEPSVRRWADSCAVGHATVAEIDSLGILAALRIAALRALEQCGPVDAIVLDGSHDWLTVPGSNQPAQRLIWDQRTWPTVFTRVKADRTCSSVAAASVAAKVTRDRLMQELHHQAPEYGWAINKGYSTAQHGAAIRSSGLTHHHRRSWNISGAADQVLAVRA